MAKRGPKPKLPQVLRLSGATLATKREEETIPAPAGMPVKPDWLNEQASKKWDEVVYFLDIMNVLSRVDGDSVLRYVLIYCRWIDAEKVLSAQGTTSPTFDKEGNEVGTQARPEVAMAAKLLELLARVCAELGLSPVSRIKLPKAQPKKDSEKDKARFFQTG